MDNTIIIIITIILCCLCICSSIGVYIFGLSTSTSSSSISTTPTNTPSTTPTNTPSNTSSNTPDNILISGVDGQTIIFKCSPGKSVSGGTINYIGTPINGTINNSFGGNNSFSGPLTFTNNYSSNSGNSGGTIIKYNIPANSTSLTINPSTMGGDPGGIKTFNGNYICS